jgi:enoyl-CoA hydratase/carnithine racemase
MDFETILFEKQDGVATITLNRPKAYNAFNLKMADELSAAWEVVKTAPDITCAILTGAGEKAFCTGMDVTAASDDESRETGNMGREDAPWFRLTPLQNRCWKPVILAINGMVNGGGFHFVADCDITLCADHATFFDTHVKIGLVAGLEPVGLSRRLPLESVLRLALLGGAERMDAQEALRIGLVGEVVPSDDLMARAREIASKIAGHSPTALARTKKAIWQGLETGLDAAIDNAWNIIGEHNDCPDIAEGGRAFMEKRAPEWVPFTESD